MKRKATGFILLLLLGGLAATGCKEVTSRRSEPSTAENGRQPQMTGAYTALRTPSDEEMALFRSAMGAEGEGLPPVSVATQVVAGLNYKFLCRRDGREAQAAQAASLCWVVIYKDLQGNVTVTSLTLAD